MADSDKSTVYLILYMFRLTYVYYYFICLPNASFIRSWTRDSTSITTNGHGNNWIYSNRNIVDIMDKCVSKYFRLWPLENEEYAFGVTLLQSRSFLNSLILGGCPLRHCVCVCVCARGVVAGCLYLCVRTVVVPQKGGGMRQWTTRQHVLSLRNFNGIKE